MFADSLEYSSERGGSDSSHEHLQDIAYEEGAMLTLRAHDLENRLVTVRILKLYPFSYSCVMKVEILHGLHKTDRIAERAVLKLYDRRFAAKLRSEHKVGPWNSEIEEKYVDFVRTGSAIEFLTQNRRPESCNASVVRRNEVQNETYLQGLCSDTLTNEMETYRSLKDLQGQQIPQIYSTVSTVVRGSIAGAKSATRQSLSLLQVRGFLMEHIVGPTLVMMPEFIPARHWQSLVGKTLELISTMHDLGVVNEDIKATDIIVNPVFDQSAQHQIFMIDLARCIVRHEGQSDRDWAMLKTELDQEGTILRAMSVKLKSAGFVLESGTFG